MSDKRTFIHKGLPDDLLTSQEIDVRRLKVESELSEIGLGKASESTNVLLIALSEIRNELKLLNARFEEMANTKINENDIREK